MDSKDFISRQEHEEFAHRMDDEHKRQNHRITEMEEICKQNNKLLASVEKLALNMENMQKEVSEQGRKLEELESRDGQMWRKVSGYVVTTILGILIAYVFNQIGIM